MGRHPLALGVDAGVLADLIGIRSVDGLLQMFGMHGAVADAFRETLDDNVARACERVRASGNPFYAAMPAEAMHASVKRIFSAVGEDLAAGEPQAYPAILGAVGIQRSSMGVAVGLIMDGMWHGFEQVSEMLAARFPDDAEARLYWERMRGDLAYRGVASLAPI